MQGFVFCQFQEYVSEVYGFQVLALLSEGKKYTLFSHYPTAEFKTLVKGLSDLVHRPHHELLEEFGVYAAPKLWSICKKMVPSKWTLNDLLFHITDFADHLLACSIAGTQKLLPTRCEKTAPNEVTFHYELPYNMCAMSKGVVQGLAHQFGTCVTITEVESQVVFSIARS